jgi:hypothetical protein
MTNYEKLMAKLDAVGEQPLTKSVEGEEGVAAEEVVENAEAEAATEENVEAADVEEELGEVFEVQGKDGEIFDAVDGTQLVKSLIKTVQEQGLEIKAQEKAINKVTDVMLTLTGSQETLVKSLQAELAALKKAGSGRKSVLTISEKPDATTLTKSEPAGMEQEEFMAKAMAAQKEGKVMASEISIAENALFHGLAVPERIVKKVLLG